MAMLANKTNYRRRSQFTFVRIEFIRLKCVWFGFGIFEFFSHAGSLSRTQLLSYGQIDFLFLARQARIFFSRYITAGLFANSLFRQTTATHVLSLCMCKPDALNIVIEI